MASLSGRVALVTGGGRGLGAEVARALAAEGAKVCVLGRNQEAVSRVAREIEGLPLCADVTKPEDMAAALRTAEEHLGAIGICVQNAGISSSAPLAKTDDETFSKIFEVNVSAVFRLSRALVPKMAEAGYGRMIHVASNAGLTGYAYTSAYCASKHAVVGLTRALAVEFAQQGVTVNAVCPGFLDTDMTHESVSRIVAKTGRSTEEARKILEAMNPQKRFVTTTEVAHLVVSLARDEARGVNGQAVAIDGGQVMV